MLVGRFSGVRTKIKIPEKIAIIGAGLAGSLTAFALNQRGIDCDVFEQNSFVASQSSGCLLYTSPSPRDATLSRMPSSA